MAFRTIHSEIVYQGRAFNVRRDEVELPNKNITLLDIIEHVGAVTLLPLDDEGQIWFVRQYRHASGQELLELPAGTLEPGERPEECARREAREEIGMAAGKIQKLGEFFLAPGYSTEYMHVYLLTDLRPDPLKGDDDEFLRVEQIKVEQVYPMVWQGLIRDAKSLAALMLARPLLSLPHSSRRGSPGGPD